MKSTYVIDTCKYLAIVAIITIIFYTTLIIYRSLNWQSNVLKSMTLREGLSFGNDDDDDSDKKKTAKEINDEFDPDDFREKARKMLDLYEEIEKTQGKMYIGALIGMNRTLIRDIDYVKNLWDEEEDEWKEKAYSELAESKFKKYNLTMLSAAVIFDEIIEKAETKESYQKKYEGIKDFYGIIGTTYIKRLTSITLDKDMDIDMDMDMDMDMDVDLGKKSSMGFF